jgi:hypothetical protein
METTVVKNDSSTSNPDWSKLLDWVPKGGGPVLTVQDGRDLIGMPPEAGDGWWVSRYKSDSDRDWESLHRHVKTEDGTLVLELNPAASSTEARTRWRATLLIAEGSYVWCHGVDENFAAALGRLLEHKSHFLTVDGAKFWMQNKGDRESWVSFLSKEETIEVRKENDSVYSWTNTADLGLLGSHISKIAEVAGFSPYKAKNGINGDASTLEGAISAALEAPSKLKRLCFEAGLDESDRAAWEGFKAGMKFASKSEPKSFNVSLVSGQQQAPDDDLDPMIAPIEVVGGLVNQASDPFQKGFLTGIHDFRQQLSILTQREF